MGKKLNRIFSKSNKWATLIALLLLAINLIVNPCIELSYELIFLERNSDSAIYFKIFDNALLVIFTFLISKAIFFIKEIYIKHEGLNSKYEIFINELYTKHDSLDKKYEAYINSALLIDGTLGLKEKIRELLLSILPTLKRLGLKTQGEEQKSNFCMAVGYIMNAERIMNDNVPNYKPEKYLSFFNEKTKNIEAISFGDGTEWFTPEGIKYLLKNHDLKDKVNVNRIFCADVEFSDDKEKIFYNNLTSLKFIKEFHNKDDIKFYFSKDILNTLEKENDSKQLLFNLNLFIAIMSALQALKGFDKTKSYYGEDLTSFHEEFTKDYNTTYSKIEEQYDTFISVLNKITEDDCINNDYPKINYWREKIKQKEIYRKYIPDYVIIDKRIILFQKGDIEQIIAIDIDDNLIPADYKNQNEGRVPIFNKVIFEDFQKLYNAIEQAGKEEINIIQG
jgi:hypothetical protein